jgi:putative flippase GtrA
MHPIERVPSSQFVMQEVLDASRETPPVYKRLSIHALLIEPTNNTFAQFARYTIVGAAALLADLATLFLLTHFGGVYYLVSAAVAFSIGLMINYLVSAVWVFAHRTVQNRTVEFGIFAAIGVAGLGLNELGMWLLSGLWGVYYLWAKLITAVLVYFWNFGARKVALFR